MLHYHRNRTFGGLPEIDRQIRLTATEVDRLRRLLNPINPEPAGEMSSCPEAPDTATIAFTYSGKQVLFSAELGGCSGIQVKADGQDLPYLRGGYALAGPIRDDGRAAADAAGLTAHAGDVEEVNERESDAGSGSWDSTAGSGARNPYAPARGCVAAPGTLHDHPMVA